jgi:glycosyltransferase involved in cell wall biosynthesis
MRIGIDASTWDNRRGFGRFTRELVSAMLQLPTAHRFVLFFDGAPPPHLNAECVPVTQQRPVTESAVAEGSRSARDLLRFTSAVARRKLDVLFYPAVYSWFPCPPGLPNLVTLHDAIAEHYPALVFPQWRYRTMWRLKLRLARWQASRLLTVSAAAREEICTYMGEARHRIDLTTEGPKAVFKPQAAEAAPQRHALAARLHLPAPARWFSFVGGFGPHKNVLGLIDAFAHIAAERTDVHLLLVGDAASAGFHSNMEQIGARLQEANLAARVHFTGFVNDDELALIYATSIATVLPSFSEGFGLPIVESMACGTPVLAANVGSMPEVLGDAGLLFAPDDTPAIAAAMRRLRDDDALSAELRGRALRRAGLFTWAQAARMALQSIERCVPVSAR